MKFTRIFEKKGPKISFEFFPPKTEEGAETLLETIKTFKGFHPAFVSVTYGAGGATRARTVDLVGKVKRELGLEAAAHLTCVGHAKDELSSILSDLKKQGVENIVALRGDPPKGETTFRPVPNGFRYAAELVEFIKSHYDFGLAVAGYPEKHVEAESLERDLGHLKAKVEKGGDIIITQLFFNNQDYFDFVEKVRALGIQNPIVPGIMPIKDYRQIVRFAKMCGAAIPAKLAQRLDAVKDHPDQVEAIGIEQALGQCQDLLKNGAPGIHFYTLNKSNATKAIYEGLQKEGLV